MYCDFALILIVLGIAVPLLGWRRIRQLMQAPKTTKSVRLKLYASTTASQWIAASVIFWRARAHGIQAAQLGIEIPNPVLVLSVSITLTALILVNQVISLRALSEHPEEIKGVLPQLAQRIFPQDTAERGAFSGVVLTVALCEEFIFSRLRSVPFPGLVRRLHSFRDHRFLSAFRVGALISGPSRFTLDVFGWTGIFWCQSLDWQLIAFILCPFRCRSGDRVDGSFTPGCWTGKSL